MDILRQDAAANRPILAWVQVRHTSNRLDAGQGSDVLQLLNSFAFDPGSVRVESVDRRAAAHGGRIAHRTLSSEVNGSLRDGRRNRRRAHAMASAHRYRGSFKPDPRRGGMTKSS